MTGRVPGWFAVAEEVTSIVMDGVARAASGNSMSLQVKFLPRKAHWFLLDSLYLANGANRDGMHANALSLTRQCFEAMGVVELGICAHPDAELALVRWEKDELPPGKLRGWLETNVWPSYGVGLWGEPWSQFMRQFASALQPYAHYSAMLSQWQDQIFPAASAGSHESERIIRMAPRAYDPQKATRITLMHAILTYVLGRICIASTDDRAMALLVHQLGTELSKSKYLDGRDTQWGQQFWAMLWGGDGAVLLE